jgi:hypothetical protein
MTRGYITFDSTQRTQSENKHGKAVKATQLWDVIIYGWANTDTDSFYLLSFEDIMAMLEDLDEGLKSSWAPSVEDSSRRRTSLFSTFSI